MKLIFGENTKQYLLGGGLIIAAIVFLFLVSTIDLAVLSSLTMAA